MKNKKETSNKFLLLFYSYPRIAIAIILVLVNLVVVALFTGILALVRETNYFSELPYVFIFTMSSDGLYDYTADKDIACLVIKIVLALIQMVIFSGALIGFTTDVLSSTFDTRLENKGKLHLKNHYVLLNWSSIGPNIVYELSFLEGEQTIVILSENERDEVINSIDNIFTLNNKKKKGVRIFVKKGDPNSLKHLSDISIDNAKCVGILLKDHEDVLSEEKGISTNDLNAFKLLMSIINVSDTCNIVMETEHNDSVVKIEKLLQLTNKDVAHRVALFSHNSIIGHILGRAVTNPTFSYLFDEIFGFDGVEFYSFPTEDIEEALSKYNDCIPVINYENYLSSNGEKQLYVLSDEASSLGIRKTPLIDIKDISFKDDIKKEQFNLYVLSDGNRHEFVISEIESYNKMYNTNVVTEVFSYDKDITPLIEALKNDTGKKKLLFLSNESEDLNNQDADIFVSLMNLKLNNAPLDDVEIYCEVVNPNNLRSLKNLGVASIIVSNKIISLFMIQLLTHKSSRRFYRDIIVAEGIDEEDSIDFDILKAGDLIDMKDNDTLSFKTYSQFVQSFYKASNHKYMVIGRKEASKDASELEFFCDKMDKEIDLNISKDDELIVVRYN